MKKLFCIVAVMIPMIFMPNILYAAEGKKYEISPITSQHQINSLESRQVEAERTQTTIDKQNGLGESNQLPQVEAPMGEQNKTASAKDGLLIADDIPENKQQNIEEGISMSNDSEKQGLSLIDMSAPTSEDAIAIQQAEIVNSFVPDLTKASSYEKVMQVIKNIFVKLTAKGYGPLSTEEQQDIVSTVPVKIDTESTSWIQACIQKILDVLRKKNSGSVVISAEEESSQWLTLAKSKITEEQSKRPDTTIILEEFAKLPAKARPADILAALDQMDNGEIMHDAILSGDRNQITNVVNAIDGLKDDDASKTMLINLLTGKDAQAKSILAEKVGADLSKSDPVKFKAVRDAYLNILVDMQWGLFKKSMVQKEGFASGAITVVDPTNNLMTSMENYVKFVNPKYYNAKGSSIASITSGDAYSRSGNLSSHWKGQVEGNRIYGIDVKIDGKYTQALPQNKDQLHFAQLTDNRVFIKWEEYGTTLNMQDTSMLSHSVTFLESQAGVKKAASRTESKMPKDVKAEFNTIVTQSKIKLTPDEAKIVKQQGISGMRNIINKKAPSDALIAFDKFLTQTKSYDPKTLEFRKANEVILSSNNASTVVSGDNNLGVVA